ncbi:AAA family ATPase [Nocardia sp. 2YAB30]|uniref:ATP-binding protein n=1 Tax=Nocardia sp. 2YAB30 TaxID=3233022 RepID=UPI003F9D790F
MSTIRAEFDSAAGDFNRFVGREPELARIIALMLGAARLVTLIGPGGIGKTRLAAETIHRYRKVQNVAVHWVRLARMAKGSTRTAIEEEVAQSVLEADFSDRSAFDALVDTFTASEVAGHTILVMDNCEHVVIGAGQLIADFLAAVPSLTILATSREPIGWADECPVTVPPLTQDESFSLFRQRASLLGRTIADDDERSMVKAICRHVHHHPLFIRLAAGQLLRKPLTMIAGELTGDADDKRMQWRNGPRVGADPRHRAVSDVTAWSYELCSDKERLLLDRMSVFAAGHDINPTEKDDHNRSNVGVELSTIKSVCSDAQQTAKDEFATLDETEIERVLERLVEQSLVISQISASTVRYSLLESIQLFAQKNLRERSGGASGEYNRLAGRHLAYYRRRALEARATWFGPAERKLLDWARAEWDNILTAIEFSLTSPSTVESGLEICCGLIALRVPFFKGSIRETRHWTERSLAAARALPRHSSELEVDALSQLVLVTLCQGQHEEAERLLERCIMISLPEAHKKSDWRHSPEVDLGLPAPAEFAWGVELLLAQRDPQAVAVLDRARRKCDSVGEHGGSAMSEMFAAMTAAFLGTAQEAFDIARSFRDRSATSGALWMKSWGEMVWALTLTKHGNPAEALEFERTALEHQVPTHDQWGALWVIEFKIWSLAQIISGGISQGNTDRTKLRSLATETAHLIGGTRSLRARLGVDIDGLRPFGDETRRAISVARRVLGPELYAQAEGRGALLRPEYSEVQRVALGTMSINQSKGSPPSDGNPHWGELSAAEQDVAILAAAGWTNGAIAMRRGNSAKTVEAQVAAVLRKLMVASRVDIVRFVPEDRMETVRIEEGRRPARRNARKRK